MIKEILKNKMACSLIVYGVLILGVLLYYHLNKTEQFIVSGVDLTIGCDLLDDHMTDNNLTGLIRQNVRLLYKGIFTDHMKDSNYINMSTIVTRLTSALEIYQQNNTENYIDGVIDMFSMYLRGTRGFNIDGISATRGEALENILTNKMIALKEVLNLYISGVNSTRFGIDIDTNIVANYLCNYFISCYAEMSEYLNSVEIETNINNTNLYNLYREEYYVNYIFANYWKYVIDGLSNNDEYDVTHVFPILYNNNSVTWNQDLPSSFTINKYIAKLFTEQPDIKGIYARCILAN